MRAGRSVRAVAALVLAVLLGGCGVTAEDLPLPGTGVPDGAYTLTAVFDDALNLAQGAQVRVDGVRVGRVTAIGTRGFAAEVTMAIDPDVEITTRTVARLRATTALGELYVEMRPPAPGDGGDPGTPLEDGDELDPAQTEIAATVEDSLAAASALINGGSLAQVQTIVSELNDAVGGRRGTARQLLRRTETFLAEANRSTTAIDRALTALADAGELLDRRRASIDRALVELRPAAAVLRRSTDDLVGLLERSDRLSRTTDRVVREIRGDLLQVLRQLHPILDELIEIEDLVGPGLDAVTLFARRFDAAVPGDYLNLRFIQEGRGTLGLPDLPGSPELELPALPELPVVPGLLDQLGLGPLLGGGRR